MSKRGPRERDYIVGTLAGIFVALIAAGIFVALIAATGGTIIIRWPI